MTSVVGACLAFVLYPSTVVRATSSTKLEKSKAVWLCRPGMANDPCGANGSATSVGPNGVGSNLVAASVRHSAFDCFYVYPTVSSEPTANADLRVQAAEIDIAVAQASRFSSVCNVWAPMYRQQTLSSLANGLGSDPAANAVAYQSLYSGWLDYLQHFNDNRPIIFIGHSQGSAMLILLLRNVIDRNPTLRARMVSAIIPGGNVTVPIGKTIGGSFSKIPICSHSGQISCVIAYSSFPSKPPSDTLFGRPGQGVSLQWGSRSTKGLVVACVNPAAIGGNRGELEPYFLAATVAGAFSTPWVTYPNMYSASCELSGDVTWLHVIHNAVREDVRTPVTEFDGPRMGFHPYDINLALGNLIHDVALQESAYSALVQ